MARAPAAASRGGGGRRGPCRTTWSSRSRGTARARRRRPATGPRRGGRSAAGSRTSRGTTGSRRRCSVGRSRRPASAAPSGPVCRAADRGATAVEPVVPPSAAVARRDGQQPAPVLRGVRVLLLPRHDRAQPGARCRGSRRSRAPRRPRAATRPAPRRTAPPCSRPRRPPAAPPSPLRSAASSSASTLSFLACSTNPQVLTSTVSAAAGSSTSRNPSAASRPASSSESTSLRAQPSVTTATDREFPLIGRAVVLAARAAVPGGELGLVLRRIRRCSSVSIANCRQFTTSSSIWSGVQKMCASSCVKPRTRSSPCMHAGTLVAIDRAQLAQPHRQVAIAAQPVRVDQDVERAVHRLELVFGIVQLHPLEHVLGVEIRSGPRSSTDRRARRAACRPASSRAPGTRSRIQSSSMLADRCRPWDGRRSSPGPASSWMLNRSSSWPSLRWSRFLASSSRLQVLVELLRREERRAVDALHLLVLLVAFPIRAGDREQLERLESLRVEGTCGPRQKSMNCGPSVYSEKMSPAFSSISSHFMHSPICAYFSRPSALRRQLCARTADRCFWISHILRLDLLEVFGSERRVALEIVVEAGFGGRSDAELRLRETAPAPPRPADARSSGGTPPALRDSSTVRICSVASPSSGRVRSYSSPLTRATTASSARRGADGFRDVDGRVPAGTCCWLPSGRVTVMLLMFG